MHFSVEVYWRLELMPCSCHTDKQAFAVATSDKQGCHVCKLCITVKSKHAACNFADEQDSPQTATWVVVTLMAFQHTVWVSSWNLI